MKTSRGLRLASRTNYAGSAKYELDSCRGKRSVKIRIFVLVVHTGMQSTEAKISVCLKDCEIAITADAEHLHSCQ